MINRSAIKYHLKKILPRPFFKLVVFLWGTIFLHIVRFIDTMRLSSFNGPEITRLEHNGVHFNLYISPDNGFIDKHIYLYGVYEPFILDVISKYLKKGMTFVDIGANIGQHSMYASKLVGKAGAVYSFEPIPHIYTQLIDSAESNHCENIIHGSNVALGAKNKKEKFHVSDNIGGSSLVNKEESGHEIEVEVRNGDEELEVIPEINMIKIDVEGYEFEVLEGIQATLKKHKPILIIEYSGDFYHLHTEKHGEKILSLLSSLKYDLYDIEDDMRKIDDPETFIQDIENTRKQTNLLCIPNIHEI